MTDIKITPSPYGTWEYVPAGGMALTAEQVEDVRLLAASVVKTNRGAAFEARDRLRALFPATEPPEEFSCTWGTVGCTCDGPLGDVAQKAANAAPAEPAEEETKAEALTTFLEGVLDYDSADIGWHLPGDWDPTDLADAIVHAPTSSPVVPAPTETGPWKHRVNGEICVASPASGLPYTIGKFNDHGDFVWHSSSAELPEGFAPFVAAEEG